MRSKKLIIGTWFIYLFFLVGFYFMEMLFIPKEYPVRFMEYNQLIPFFVGSIILIAVYFYFEHKYNHEKVNIPIAVILGGLFIMNTISILLFPDTKDITAFDKDGSILYSIVYLTMNDRMFYIMSAFISSLVIYICFAILPKKYYFIRIINVAYILAMIFMVVLMTYSFIAEWQIYVDFFGEFIAKGVTGFPVPKSFLPNRNNFGFVYLIMICFTLFVHHNRPKWWLYVIALVLLLCSLPCLSKTNFAASVFIMLFYIFCRFFLTFREHKKRNIIAASIITTLLIGLTVTIVLSFYQQNEFFEFINRIIMTTFKFEDGYYSTLSGRIPLWELTIHMIKENNAWVTGIGHGWFNSLLLEYSTLRFGKGGTRMPHNGFLEILGQGGFVLVGLYAALFCYLLYKLIRIFKYHKSLACFEIGMLIVIIEHMAFESASPLVYSIPTVDSLIFTFLFAIPILNARWKDKNSKELSKISDNKRKLYYSNFVKNKFSVAYLLIFILAPFVGFAIGAPTTMFINDGMPLWYIGVIAGAVLIYYLIPLWLNAVIYKKKQYRSVVFREYLKHVAIYQTVLLVIVGGLFAASYFITFGDWASLMFVSFAWLMLYFALFMFIKPLHGYSDCFITFIDNWNILEIKIYSPYIRDELEYNVNKKARLEHRYIKHA